jgi:hypothetical protein
MATPITWRNVSGPNHGASLRAFSDAGKGLGDAISGLGDEVQDFSDEKTKRDTAEFVSYLQSLPTDADRKNAVQQADEATRAFMDDSAVTSAVTDLQNQDFRVADEQRAVDQNLRLDRQEVRDQASFESDEAGKADDLLTSASQRLTAESQRNTAELARKKTKQEIEFNEKADPKRLRQLEDSLEFARDKNERDEITSQINAAKDFRARIAFNQEQKRIRDDATLTEETRAKSLRDLAKQKTVFTNDTKAQPLLDTLADPGKTTAERNAALGKLEEMQSTRELSADMTARIARATKDSLSSQTGAAILATVPGGAQIQTFSSARNALGGVVTQGVLAAYTTGRMSAAILAAPKNLRATLESKIVSGLRGKPENKGLSERHLAQIAKQHIKSDPNVSSFLAQVDAKDKQVKDLNEAAVEANLGATKVELGFASKLRTGSYGELADSLNQRFTSTGEATVDGAKTRRVIKNVMAKAQNLLSKAGISSTAISVAVVKVLNNTIGDSDTIDRNDLYLPGYGDSGGLHKGDVSGLSKDVLLQALMDQLPAAMQNKVLSNTALQKLLNP